MKLLITGCTGFVGRALLVKTQTQFEEIVGTSRQPENSDLSLVGRLLENASIVHAPGFEGKEWVSLLQGVDVIVHCAARVHKMKDDSFDPLEEFRKVNRDGTATLARQAVKAGVKKFIFISSIKVNGERTEMGRPFKADDTPNPSSPYGISKYEAEIALSKIAEQGGMQWIVVRPTLVYGPEPKGNLALLEKCARYRIPLPLGGINNRRSLVSLDNLTDVLVACCRSDLANQILLVSDLHPVSTEQIFKAVSRRLGRTSLMFSLPWPLDKWLIFGLRKAGLYDRLAGDLEVDIAQTQDLLGWKPEPFNMSRLK